MDARIASLRSQEIAAAESERLRESGELIYANLWQLQPGQSSLEVDGRVIALDPGRPAKETAQEYFERYRKARAASAHLPQLIEQAELDRRYLSQRQHCILK